MSPQENEEKQLTPQEDIEIFKNELEQENYDHALFHLACAIGSDPENEEWLFYASTVFDILGSGVLNYIELGENVYFATAALRAYYLWRVGEFEPAVSLLSQVIAAVPDIPYFAWMEKWILDVDSIRQVSEDTMYRFISRNLYQMDQHTASRGKEVLRRLTGLFSQYAEPTAQTYMSKYMVLSMLYRRLDQMDKALEAALTGYEKVPTAVNSTFVALCYKDMGDIDHMKEYTNLSLTLDPKSTAICNDMGDVLLDSERYQEASEYYGIAMGEDDEEWSEPSYYYCRFCMDGEDAQEMNQLLGDYAKKHPNSQRAQKLVQDVQDKLYPEHARFYYNMPFLEEALSNLLHNISSSYAEKYGSAIHVKNKGEAGSIRTTITCLESPSAVRALNLYLSDYDSNDCSVDLICSNCPQPSPLEPVQGRFKLWDYDESYHFTSRVKRPSSHVLEVVKELALENYSLEAWYQRALLLADSLAGEDRESLYGAMVYPPRCSNENYYMDWWLERVQFAAVFLLAALDEREGMILSPAACDICMGQIDWPLLPAMLLITYQAICHEEVQSSARVILYGLMDRIYKKEFCFFTVTFLVCMLNLPGVEEKNKAAFKKWLTDELRQS